MSSTYCTSCNDKLFDEEIRWAFDEPYCEDCFNERFDYCTSCDAVLMRSDAHYNNEDDAYCDDCWQNDYDPCAPDNPDVYEEDRKLILRLSRAWLQGKVETRRLISINEKDLHLREIRSKVGLVHNSIYIFGLKDREEYQISASANILEDVKEFVLLHFSGCNVIEGFGNNRLGVSLTLRKEHQPEIINLIKRITSVEKPVLA